MATGAELGALEPIATAISNTIGILQYTIGGLFGAYLLLLIYKIYQGHQLQKDFEVLKKEIVRMREVVERIEHHQERRTRKQ